LKNAKDRKAVQYSRITGVYYIRHIYFRKLFFSIEGNNKNQHMRKAAIITLALVATSFVMSCSSSRTGGSYFGVTNSKMNKKRQKEFKKPKHRISTSAPEKKGN